MIYIFALAVPLVLLIAGSLAKKLVRGKGWVRTDFFLGVELALASMSAGLVFVYELSTKGVAIPASELARLLGVTSVFLIINFFILLWIMAFHQDWETRNDNPKGQRMRLGYVTNGMGVLLFFGFVIFVKGVSLWRGRL